MIVSAGLLLIVAIFSGVYAGWWVLHNADARLTLTDQAAQVMIPNAVPVKADILTDLDVMLMVASQPRFPLIRPYRFRYAIRCM